MCLSYISMDSNFYSLGGVHFNIWYVLNLLGDLMSWHGNFIDKQGRKAMTYLGSPAVATSHAPIPTTLRMSNSHDSLACDKRASYGFAILIGCIVHCFSTVLFLRFLVAVSSSY